MKAQVGFSQLLANLLIPTFAALTATTSPAATSANDPPTISNIADQTISENAARGVRDTSTLALVEAGNPGAFGAAAASFGNVKWLNR